jgi:hypothetical protein
MIDRTLPSVREISRFSRNASAVLKKRRVYHGKGSCGTVIIPISSSVRCHFSRSQRFVDTLKDKPPTVAPSKPRGCDGEDPFSAERGDPDCMWSRSHTRRTRPRPVALRHTSIGPRVRTINELFLNESADALMMSMESRNPENDGIGQAGQGWAITTVMKILAHFGNQLQLRSRM